MPYLTALGHPVLRDISADETRSAAGGIDRIKQPLSLDSILKRLGDNSGFDYYKQVVFVDFDYPIEALHGERNSAVNGERASGKPGSGAAKASPRNRARLRDEGFARFHRHYAA